jgi:hypothetical protein
MSVPAVYRLASLLSCRASTTLVPNLGFVNPLQGYIIAGHSVIHHITAGHSVKKNLEKSLTIYICAGHSVIALVNGSTRLASQPLSYARCCERP